MELADMQDLGSCAARRAGSSPVIRTRQGPGVKFRSGLFLYLSPVTRDYSTLHKKVRHSYFKYNALKSSLSRIGSKQLLLFRQQMKSSTSVTSESVSFFSPDTWSKKGEVKR